MAGNGEALLSSSGFWDDGELANQRCAKAKGMIFLALICLCYACLAHVLVPQDAPPASPLRAASACILAGGMLLEFGVDLTKMPAPKRQDEIFELLASAGKPIFLTFWILCIQTVQAVGVVVAEVSLLSSWPCLRLLTVCYTLSSFVGALGVVLTLLFLKFNWFEEKWQTNVRRLWEGRGIPFGLLTLLSHIPSMPVGILDVAIKDSTLLRLCAPLLYENVLAVFIFSMVYFIWIHIFWALSGFQCW
eukprot:CAMPEP_0117563840 /NCGR_PEP_ID=MMETSP0784-20121206/55713_1 /TAXON_ID=39447 /ORGANISM="" /LENGTH=246 /DNA_ID=CAMNT_0005361521 /DNA_START=76 /DNA_END=813 /DNA_ORIENTATION=+